MPLPPQDIYLQMATKGEVKSIKNGHSMKIDQREDDIQKQLSLPGKENSWLNDCRLETL